MKYALNEDYTYHLGEQVYQDLAHVNGVSINSNCSGVHSRFWCFEDGGTGLMRAVRKALF